MPIPTLATAVRSWRSACRVHSPSRKIPSWTFRLRRRPGYLDFVLAYWDSVAEQPAWVPTFSSSRPVNRRTCVDKCRYRRFQIPITRGTLALAARHSGLESSNGVAQPRIVSPTRHAAQACANVVRASPTATHDGLISGFIIGATQQTPRDRRDLPILWACAEPMFSSPTSVGYAPAASAVENEKRRSSTAQVSETALADLYAKYSPAIYAHCRRFLQGLRPPPRATLLRRLSCA